MKIISKFKDYYDYLSGIYGQDEKLVYYRNGEPKTESSFYYTHHSDDRLIEFNICNKLYFGLYTKELGWVTDTEFIFNYIVNDAYLRKWYHGNLSIKLKLWLDYSHNSHFKQGMEAVNKVDSPIYCKNIGSDFNLSQTFIPKLIPATDLYLSIVDFISPKDTIIKTNPTDMNLFESKGFDKKTSFRKV